MSVVLASRLLRNESAPAIDVIAALERELLQHVPFVHALVRLRSDYRTALEREFATAEVAEVAAVAVDRQLASLLPPGLCAQFLMVPMARRLSQSVVDVACVDPWNQHALAEISYHLGIPVRPLRASTEAVERALSTLIREEPETPIGHHADQHGSEPSSVGGGAGDRYEPIPLVRVLGESDAPRTRRGVAPEAGMRTARGSVVVPPRRGDPRTTAERPPEASAPEAPRPPRHGIASTEPPEAVRGSPHPAAKAPLGSPAGQRPSSAPPSRESFAPETTPQFDFELKPRPKSSRPKPAEVPQVVDQAEIAAALSRLEQAEAAESVVEELARIMGYKARLVAVFLVRGKALRLKAHFGPQGIEAPEGNPDFPSDQPSLLRDALGTGVHAGYLSDTPVDARLAPLLAGISGRVLASVVTVSGRPTILVAAGGFDSESVTEQWIRRATAEAGATLERIVRARKSR